MPVFFFWVRIVRVPIFIIFILFFHWFFFKWPKRNLFFFIKRFSSLLFCFFCMFIPKKKTEFPLVKAKCQKCSKQRWESSSGKKTPNLKIQNKSVLQKTHTHTTLTNMCSSLSSFYGVPYYFFVFFRSRSLVSTTNFRQERHSCIFAKKEYVVCVCGEERAIVCAVCARNP